MSAWLTFRLCGTRQAGMPNRRYRRVMASLRLASIVAVFFLLFGCAATTVPPTLVATNAATLPVSISSGGGWQLLKTVNAGIRYVPVVQAASTPDEWNTLWASVGSSDPQPVVNLDRSVVVAFDHVHGSNC